MPPVAAEFLDFALEVMLKVNTGIFRPDFEIRWTAVDEMVFSTRPLQQNRKYGDLLRGFLV